MKILVCVPGAWSHGLNSPERGESRWAQQYAKMLVKAGHEVWACSMGPAPKGDGKPPFLISERQAKNYGPFDLYFDSSWWQGKRPYAQAKKYVHVNWSLEEHLRPPLPKDHYLAYPYPSATPFFIHPVNQNIDRTFCLPTMFSEGEFAGPKFNNQKLFLPARGLDRSKPDLEHAILGTLRSVRGSKIEAILSSFLFRNYKDEIVWDTPGCRWSELLPYDQLRDIMKTCKLNVPVQGPSCVLDAAADGVPTIMWEEGGFFIDTARKHGLLIERGASHERIYQVIHTLLNDEGIYNAFLADIQDFLSCHKYTNAIQYFNRMVERIY